MSEYDVNDLDAQIKRTRQRLERYRSTFKDSPVKTTLKIPKQTQQDCVSVILNNPWNRNAFELLARASFCIEDYSLASYAFMQLRELGKNDPEVIKGHGLSCYFFAKKLDEDKKYPLAVEQMTLAKNMFEEYNNPKDSQIAAIREGIDAEILAIRYKAGGIKDLERIAGKSAELDKKDHGHVEVGELEEIVNNPATENSKRINAANKLSEHYANDPKKAIGYLSLVQGLDTTSDTRKRIANIRLKASWDDDSVLRELIEEYKALVALRPRDADVALNLAEINFFLKNNIEGIRILQKLDTEDRKKSAIRDLKISKGLLEIGLPLSAEMHLRNLIKEIKNEEEYIAAVYMLGEAQLMQKKNTQALMTFSEVARLDIDFNNVREKITKIRNQQ